MSGQDKREACCTGNKMIKYEEIYSDESLPIANIWP